MCINVRPKKIVDIHNYHLSEIYIVKFYICQIIDMQFLIEQNKAIVPNISFGKHHI